MNANLQDNLLDGKYTFNDLVDIHQLTSIFEKFSIATGFTIGLVDNNTLEVLIKTGWHNICVNFHRSDVKACEVCKKSNKELFKDLDKEKSVKIIECDNGLYDCATPIIIENKHIANLATGQLLMNKPEISRFVKQAQEFGFNKTEYLNALKEVPIVDKNEVSRIMEFLADFSVYIAHEGLNKIRILELNEKLEKNKQDLEKLNNELEQRVCERTEQLQETNIKLNSTLKHLKKTQTQLFQSEKMASLGILTAGFSHEINNPLNFIMGAYTGLQYHFDNNNFMENRDQIEILMNALKAGIDRSSNIIHRLNQFSRESETSNEDCYVHVILDNCLSILQCQINNKIKIKKRYTSSNLIIKGNEGKLHQVFFYIIDNAIQSITSDEGIISVSTKIIKQNVVIIISDNGEGIPEENIKKVIDPFYTTKEPGKGTGLGLAIAYYIIKEHKGKLKIQSKYGFGTVIKIILPSSIWSENV